MIHTFKMGENWRMDPIVYRKLDTLKPTDIVVVEGPGLTNKSDLIHVMCEYTNNTHNNSALDIPQNCWSNCINHIHTENDWHKSQTP